jgi:hypothetical protein
MSALISASFFTPTLLAGNQKLGSNQGADPDTVQKIEKMLDRSIRANFGSGFQVLSFRKKGDITHALIEHLENRYSVTSSNMQDWNIVKSTDI